MKTKRIKKLCEQCFIQEHENIDVKLNDQVVHHLFEARVKHVNRCELCKENLVKTMICDCPKRQKDEENPKCIDERW